MIYTHLIPVRFNELLISFMNQRYSQANELLDILTKLLREEKDLSPSNLKTFNKMLKEKAISVSLNGQLVTIQGIVNSSTFLFTNSGLLWQETRVVRNKERKDFIKLNSGDVGGRYRPMTTTVPIAPTDISDDEVIKVIDYCDKMVDEISNDSVSKNNIMRLLEEEISNLREKNIYFDYRIAYGFMYFNFNLSIKTEKGKKSVCISKLENSTMAENTLIAKDYLGNELKADDIILLISSKVFNLARIIDMDESGVLVKKSGQKQKFRTIVNPEFCKVTRTGNIITQQWNNICLAPIELIAEQALKTDVDL